MSRFTIFADVVLPPTIAAVLVAVPVLVGMIQIVAFIANVVTQRRVKSIDVAADCSKRYEQLLAEIKKIGLNRDDIQRLSERYWDLQNTQFDLWKLAFLPSSLWRKWILKRHADRDRTFAKYSEGPGTAASITTRDSWDLARPAFSDDEEFQTLVDGIFTDPARAYERVYNDRGAALGATVAAYAIPVIVVTGLVLALIVHYAQPKP